jgi:hypothetical protein
MHRFLVLLAAVPIAALGCGGGPKLVAVSGRVTLDGHPAAGVHVGFQPVAAAGEKYPGGGSYAITDSDGRFTLKLVENDRTGAIVGKHRVEIASRQQADDATDSIQKSVRPKAVVPPKYNRESQLTFDVPGDGTTDANFDLTSK